MFRKPMNTEVQNRNILKRYSGILAIALISSVFLSVPSANALDAPAANSAAQVEATEEMNSIRYSIDTRTKTIFVDVADKYAYGIIFVDVKMPVTVNGKKVMRYVPIDTVILDEFGRSMSKTLVNIKAGNVIRVSVLGIPDDMPVAYITVK